MGLGSMSLSAAMAVRTVLSAMRVSGASRLPATACCVWMRLTKRSTAGASVGELFSCGANWSMTPFMSAANVSVFALSQGPSDCAHSGVSADMVIAPVNTAACVAAPSTLTTKSVPFTPIAATGVFNRNFSGLAWPHLPVMERTTPFSTLNLMATRLPADSSYCSTTRRLAGRTLTNAPSTNRT